MINKTWPSFMTAFQFYMDPGSYNLSSPNIAQVNEEQIATENIAYPGMTA